MAAGAKPSSTGRGDDDLDWETIKRVAGFILALVFGVGIWAWMHPEYGQWTYYIRPVPVIIGLLVILAAVVKAGMNRRRGQAGRVSAALAPKFGPEWDRDKEFKAFRFRKGLPQKIWADYPDNLPDYDPLWRYEIEETVRKRIDAFKVESRWDLLKGKVTISSVEFRDAVEREYVRRQEQATTRISNIVGHHLRADISIDIPDWLEVANDEDDHNGYLPTPEEFTVVYPETTTISAHMKRTLEIKLALKLGGRWDIEVDGKRDKLIVKPKFEFPEIIPHPGPALYTNEPPEGAEFVGLNSKGETIVTDKPIPGTLYYAKDEYGRFRGWLIGQKSNAPHAVVVGATGGGKTTVIRSIVAGAILQRIPVYACDPKRVELRPFQGFPGVGAIASSPEQIASLIQEMCDLMMYRYEIIEQYPELKSKFYPIVFVIDELLILTQMVAKMKAALKKSRSSRGPKSSDDEPMPANDDPMENIQALLALARTATIHVVIGVQRPDAALFANGARDNLRHRISLMRLSREGATMMYDNGLVGLDLPLKQGRCLANFDGGSPTEAQTFWLSEPGASEGHDKFILDGISAAAAKLFEGFEFPIASAKYDLVPGELSTGAKRILAQMQIPLGTLTPASGMTETLTDATDLDIPVQAVNAGSLTEGDTVHIDGAVAMVRDVETVGEAEEDQISLLLDIDGVEQYLVMDATDPIDRELILEEAAA